MQYFVLELTVDNCLTPNDWGSQRQKAAVANLNSFRSELRIFELKFRLYFAQYGTLLQYGNLQQESGF